MFDGLDEKSRRLAGFAVEYVASQIESRARCGAWGDVSVSLKFQGGQLREVETSDRTTIRPELLEGRLESSASKVKSQADA